MNRSLPATAAAAAAATATILLEVRPNPRACAQTSAPDNGMVLPRQPNSSAASAKVFGLTASAPR